jgi:hypothetical protein
MCGDYSLTQFGKLTPGMSTQTRNVPYGTRSLRGTDTYLSAKPCRLKRSMQHYPICSFDNGSPEEPIYRAVLVQNLARAGSG